MVTLIGDGSHASDIRESNRHIPYHHVRHHKEWRGGGSVLIGINDPFQRAKIASELGVEDLAWIHPDAHLYLTWCGYGTHINYGVHATRTTIGHHTTISPGVTICGDVTIGDRVLIGAGTTICDRVTIDSDTIIGAGSLVLPESRILAGTWVGSPVRRIK